MDCSLPGSSIHGILQARILEWYAPPFSRGSSQPRDQTHVLWITGRFFTSEPPGKSSYQWGRFLSAPLDRRELRSPRSSQPLRVLFVFSTQVSDSACLAVPTTYSFLEENLVFIEIRKVPRAGGYALAAVFHSILNIFFQKDAWLSCPVSQALPHCAHTHTHAHTHGLENKDQGVESLPAPPSHSHRASQDSALCCGGGSRHLPAIRAGMDSCYIISSGASTMPGDGMLQDLATAHPPLWKNSWGLQARQCSKYLWEEVVTNIYLSRIYSAPHTILTIIITVSWVLTIYADWLRNITAITLGIVVILQMRKDR